MALPSPAFVSDQKHEQPEEQNQLTSKSINLENKSYYSKTQRNNQKSFECRVCSLNFDSQQELFQHRKLHETCPFDGCKFNALETVVTAHYQRAHVTNPSLKIKDLSTPEEIAKWREERRKRYPTVANVILKQQIQSEKQQRGERIQKSDRRFGDFQQKKFIASQGRQHQTNNKRQRNQHKKSFKANHQKHLEPTSHQSNVPTLTDTSKAPQEAAETKRKTPAFQGMTIAAEKPTNALSMLGAYSSDEDDEEVREKEEQETTNLPIEKIESKKSNIESEPEEVPIERRCVEEEQSTSVVEHPKSPKKYVSNKFTKGKRRMDQNSWLLDYSKLRKTSANPFLEKLLQDDIQHERNVILQCVNFIVKNDFLGLEKSQQSSENQ